MDWPLNLVQAGEELIDLVRRICGECAEDLRRMCGGSAEDDRKVPDQTADQLGYHQRNKLIKSIKGVIYMAKVKLNPILEQVRGKFGDLVFKRYGDEVIIGRVPDMSRRTLTANQTAQLERFRLAVLYGNSVIADPNKKRLYQSSAQEK